MPHSRPIITMDITHLGPLPSICHLAATNDTKNKVKPSFILRFLLANDANAGRYLDYILSAKKINIALQIITR